MDGRTDGLSDEYTRNKTDARRHHASCNTGVFVCGGGNDLVPDPPNNCQMLAGNSMLYCSPISSAMKLKGVAPVVSLHA